MLEHRWVAAGTVALAIGIAGRHAAANDRVPETVVTIWQGGCAGALTLTHDDNRPELVTIVGPALDARGLKGTFNVVVGNLPACPVPSVASPRSLPAVSPQATRVAWASPQGGVGVPPAIMCWPPCAAVQSSGRRLAGRGPLVRESLLAPNPPVAARALARPQECKAPALPAAAMRSLPAVAGAGRPLPARRDRPSVAQPPPAVLSGLLG